jgi:hypothetical protein
MSNHDGRFWISYWWYVAACVFCVVGGFVVGRLS